MAIQERQFQSELPALMQQLLGQQTTGSSTTSSNTGPLQQVFNSAMQPMDPAMYQQLVQGIFGTASQKIPELTAALANATGSRSSNNSPLALALNEQNNLAGAQAAQAIMQFNNNNNQIAANAAGNIANSTKQVNSTERKGPGTNPLIPALGGFALNQFDKRGGMDWLEDQGRRLFSGSGTSGMPGFDLSTAFNNFNPVNAFDFGGTSLGNLSSAASYDFAPANFGGSSGTDFFSSAGGFGSGVSDFVSGAGDWLGDAASSVGSWVGDAASGVGDWLGDAASGVADFFGFADGGMVTPTAKGWNGTYQSPIRPPMRQGYANGGQVTGGGMIPARANAPMQVADFAASGGDPNLMMQRILMQAMQQQPVQAPPPNPLNFLRYLLPTSGFNIYQYADGGMAGEKPGYADGGTIRNRNNMGAPVGRMGQAAIDSQSIINNLQQQQQASAVPGGNSGTTSNQLTNMITQLLEEEQRGQGRDQGMNPSSPGGAINSAIGNPLGREAAQAFASTAGSLAMGPLAGPFGMVTGLPTSPIGFARALAGLAERENQATASINAASDPMGAMIAGMGLGTGGVTNTSDAASVANAVSALNPSIDPISALISITDGFSGSGGDGGYNSPGNFGSSGLSDTDGMNGVRGGFDADGDNGDSGGFGSFGGGGGGGSSGGVGGGSGVGGRGSTGSVGDANGGLLRGPGTGTSDSIPAVSRVPGEQPTRFSDGEFIMSRDAVDFYGEDFFKRLLMQVHRPVKR